MPASSSDALELLRQDVPPTFAKLAEAHTADLDMSLSAAAAATGIALDKARQIAKDNRYWRYVHAIMDADREACRDVRRDAIRMLAALVGYDPAEAFDKFGEVRTIHDIPPDVRAAIAQFERKVDGSIKIKFVSRLDALRLLFAHFGDIDTSTVGPATGAVRARVVFRGRGDA